MGIVAVLGAGYWFYSTWWIDQDRNGFIRNFNDSMMESEEAEVQSAPKEEGWL